MKLRVGILGLPNVGKSSLFNALARQSLAHVANFPFCTIDPTTCLVPCHDPYLERLAAWSSHNPRPATMEWVDVAGLAKNAHRGEGLGNQFLGTLRDCTCLCHVVRAFEDPNVLVHQVEDSSSTRLCDPLRDLETIQLELLLADLAHVQRRLERISPQDNQDERLVLEQIKLALQEGIPARALMLSATQEASIRSMGLLTLKPVVYAFNVDEVDFFLNRQQTEQKMQETVKEFQSSLAEYSNDSSLATLVCANVESRLSQLTMEEQLKYLSSIGLDTSLEYPLCDQVLPNMVQQHLGYSIIYTGPGVPSERSRTTRAHLIRSLTSYDLAGRIHNEIQKGFLRSQVVHADQLMEQATDFVQAKELGILRTEGRDYILQDGEVILIQWKG